MNKKGEKILIEETRKLLEKSIDKGVDIGVGKGNIVLDYLESVIQSSIERGYTSMNNGTILKHIKEARDILNKNNKIILK